jgi:uridine phosphorylase
MGSKERLPMLRAQPSDIGELALVVGEPKRAEFAAKFLDNAHEVGNYREYLSYTGEYKRKRITITSHGVGAAGASIAFNELFQAGVKTVIRGGSAGGLAPGLIIATGAIRTDGTSEQLVPIAYPAVAHYQVVQALQVAAAKNNCPNPKTGILLTRSYLYPGLIEHPWKMWFDAGVVGVEMELALLLVMAGIRGIRAGGIFASDGTLADEDTAKNTDKSGYDPFSEELVKYTRIMVCVALDALADLSSKN